MDTAAPVAPRSILERLHDALTDPDRQAQTLLSGKPVELRLVQTIYWGLMIGLAGACFVAGWYYGVLEMHWRIHIDFMIAHHHVGVNWNGFTLKNWWDGGMGFIHYYAWPDYRHAIRNLGAPAAAVMAAKTVMASSKYWNVKVSTFRLVTSPVVLLVTALALIAGGTWLLDFGLPNAWTHVADLTGNHGYTWDSYFRFLGKASAGQLLLGLFVIGPILHKIWAPTGAAIQGAALERSVARAKQGSVLRLTSGERVPLWEELPIAPPPIRVRFAKMFREFVPGTRDTSAAARAHRFLLAAALGIIVLVTILGVLAKYPIAHGVLIPYLNS